MNSFRELLESPVNTEEMIRFCGIDWLCPYDSLNGPPCFNSYLLKTWTLLFAEIGGKRFVNYGDRSTRNHISYQFHAKKFIPFLAEIDDIEWIYEKNNKGFHMGFYVCNEENIEYLVNRGGKSWLSQEDNDGKHMGFYCTDPKIMRFLIKSGGPDWLLKADNLGRHMGFYASAYYESEWLILSMVNNGGAPFVWHTDNEGRHMGFYLRDKKNLDLLIKVGGPTWIHHKDNNGNTMFL